MGGQMITIKTAEKQEAMESFCEQDADCRGTHQNIYISTQNTLLRNVN